MPWLGPSDSHCARRVSTPATSPSTRSSCSESVGPPDPVQPLALERAAQAPVEAAVEGEVPPGGDPLRALLDGVGLDFVVHRFPDTHRAVQQQLVPSVIDIERVAQQLPLRQLDYGRYGVLVEPERVLAESHHAELDRAVGDLDERQPGRAAAASATANKRDRVLRSTAW